MACRTVSRFSPGRRLTSIPVDAAFFAEGHLGGIDIHDRQIPPHRLGRAFGVENAPHLKGLDAVHGLHLDLLVDVDSFPLRHGPGKEDGIGLGQKEERVGDIGALVGEAVVADLVSCSTSTPRIMRDRSLPETSMPLVSITGTAYSTPATFCTCSSKRLGKAGLPRR